MTGEVDGKLPRDEVIEDCYRSYYIASTIKADDVIVMILNVVVVAAEALIVFSALYTKLYKSASIKQEQSIIITDANAAVDAKVKDVVEFDVANVAGNLNRLVVVALWRTTGVAEHIVADAADAVNVTKDWDSKVTGRGWTLQMISMFNMFASFMD